MSTNLEDLFDDPEELPPPPEELVETSAPEPVAAVLPTAETPEVEAVEPEEAPAQELESVTTDAPEGETPATGEGTSPTVDWERRYADIRRTQMQGLTAAQQRAEFAEAQLQSLLADKPAPRDMSATVEQIRTFAQAQGWDEAQTRQFADIVASVASASASAETQGLASQLHATQEAQRSLYASQQVQAIEAANDDTLAAFQEQNPGIAPEHQAAMLGFLADIGELESGPDGKLIPTPDQAGYRLLSHEALTAALEAARNPGVADVLRTQPEWAYSEQGIALARRLASPTPVTTQAKTTPAQVDAALAAAQTLSGPSGTRPGAAPVHDEIDDLLAPEPPKVFSR